MSDPIVDSALLSMCMTWRHNFGLLDRKEQMAIKRELLGLYEHHVKPALDRASSAESSLAAMRQRAERAEEVLRDFVSILAIPHPVEPGTYKELLTTAFGRAKELLGMVPDPGATHPADASTIGGDHIPQPVKMVGERELADSAWQASWDKMDGVQWSEPGTPMIDRTTGETVFAPKISEREYRLKELVKKADDLAETAANVCDDCDGECADCVFCNVRVFAKGYREQRAALADMEQKPAPYILEPWGGQDGEE